MAQARKAWKHDGCRWDVQPPWPGAGELAARLKTSPLIAQILHNRGFDDPDQVRSFLTPKLTDLHPPQLLLEHYQ